MMTEIDPQTTENQRICQKLVQREVHYCVSSLVSHFVGNENALDGSDYTFDDIMELCTGQDWEAAWDNSEAMVVDEEDGYYAIHKDDYEDISYEAKRDCLEVHGVLVDDPDNHQELCEALNIDPEPMEIYEHWIVSEWLGERLKEKGHPVGELFGMTIWGRPTTGQAIHLDWVIGEIAKDMEILKGQKYEWTE